MQVAGVIPTFNEEGAIGRVIATSQRRRHTASLAFCGARSLVLLAFFPTS